MSCFPFVILYNYKMGSGGAIERPSLRLSRSMTQAMSTKIEARKSPQQVHSQKSSEFIHFIQICLKIGGLNLSTCPTPNVLISFDINIMRKNRLNINHVVMHNISYREQYIPCVCKKQPISKTIPLRYTNSISLSHYTNRFLLNG